MIEPAGVCTSMYHLENLVLTCTVLYCPVHIVRVEICYLFWSLISKRHWAATCPVHIGRVEICYLFWSLISKRHWAATFFLADEIKWHTRMDLMVHTCVPNLDIGKCGTDLYQLVQSCTNSENPVLTFTLRPLSVLKSHFNPAWSSETRHISPQ